MVDIDVAKGREEQMTVKCELLNYVDIENPLDNPKVIIENDGQLSDYVRISIEGLSAVVSVKQLEKALEACTRIPL